MQKVKIILGLLTLSVTLLLPAVKADEQGCNPIWVQEYECIPLPDGSEQCGFIWRKKYPCSDACPPAGCNTDPCPYCWPDS